MASHHHGSTLQIARAGLACMLITVGCAAGGNSQLQGPQVAAIADREWRDCLRFSRAWEQASRLSPTPSLSARSVSLGPTCLEAR